MQHLVIIKRNALDHFKVGLVQYFRFTGDVYGRMSCGLSVKRWFTSTNA